MVKRTAPQKRGPEDSDRLIMAKLVSSYRLPRTREDVLKNFQITREVAERKLKKLNDDTELHFMLCTLRKEAWDGEKSCKNKDIGIDQLRVLHDKFIHSVSEWFALEDSGLVPYLPQAS